MKKTSISILICMLIITIIAAAHQDDRSELNMIPVSLPEKVPDHKTTQIRIFTINKGKMEAFVDAWTKGVYPLRIKSGFTIDGAWVVQEKNKFIWLLSSDGSESFQAKDSAYYASQGRAAINPDPAQYIADVESYFLKPVK